MGGPDAVAFHKGRGKLTVRERLDLLADPGSFQETGVLAGKATYLGAELESLRRQLAEISDKFTAANQAFMAGRKQQDTVIEHLRRELEHARGEAQSFKKKNEDLARQLQVSLQKLDKATEGLEDQGPLSVLGIAVQSLF